MAGKVKIAFGVGEDEGGPPVETIWAEPAPYGFTLLNSPFYVSGVSFLDVVTASENDGGLSFLAKVATGGHSTYRLLVTAQMGEAWRDGWQRLAAAGCSYEEALMAGDGIGSDAEFQDVKRHDEGSYSISKHDGTRRSAFPPLVDACTNGLPYRPAIEPMRPLRRSACRRADWHRWS